MKCEAARPQLESYFDGELDRAAVDEIEAHLSACSACRAELAALEQLRAAFRMVPRQHAPADLRQRLARAGELPRLESPHILLDRRYPTGSGIGYRGAW